VALTYSEDLDLIARVLKIGNAIHVPANLTSYRRHPAQDTRKIKVEILYGEKLAVVSAIARETGLLDEKALAGARSASTLKCHTVRFIQSRKWSDACEMVRQCFKSGALNYLFRSMRSG